MDDDGPNEVFAELKSRPLGGWGVAQIAAGTGLAVYAMWVGVLQPGFRKVPLRLQVWTVFFEQLCCITGTTDLCEASLKCLPGPVHPCQQNPGP